MRNTKRLEVQKPLRYYAHIVKEETCLILFSFSLLCEDNGRRPDRHLPSSDYRNPLSRDKSTYRTIVEREKELPDATNQ